jgi:iron complex transport system substrate-binding protein
VRIVSLLPSATEIICALDLEEYLVAVSHSCDFPPLVKGLPVVTGATVPGNRSGAEIDELVRQQHAAGHPLYTIDVEGIARLEPDLVLTQGLCDVCAVSEEQARAVSARLPGNPGVLSLAPRTLGDVWKDILTIGAAVGHLPRAESLVTSLETRARRVQRSVDDAEPVKVTLLEWLDPPYACGHWTPEIVALAGGVEGHGTPGARSRPMEWSEVHAWDPDALVVAGCGLSIAQARRELARTHPGWMDLRAAEHGRLHLADGNAHFSRPGPRLVDSLEWLAGVLHPERTLEGSPGGGERAIFQP